MLCSGFQSKGSIHHYTISRSNWWRTGRVLSLFSKCPTVLGSVANIGNHNVHEGFLALSFRAQIIFMIKFTAQTT